MNDDNISYKCKRSTIIRAFLVLLYFGGLVWSLALSIMLLYEQTYFYSYDSDDYHSLDLDYFPVTLLSTVPIELFFASLTFIFLCCNCCSKRIAIKVFVWLTAFFSLGPIIALLIFVFDGSVDKCYELVPYFSPTEKLSNGCFNANAMSSAILSYYILTHFVLLVYLINTDYGVPEEEEPTQPLDNTVQLYEQSTPQSTNYNQFY